MDRHKRLPRANVLGYDVPIATTRAARLLGLAFLDRERAPDGLLIPRCRAVHTFGMRFALDLLFLDRGWRVIDLRRSVPPRRVARSRAAASVLELRAPVLDPARPARRADSARFGWMSGEHHRVEFDFELTFSNGGGMQGQGFRMDISGDEISDDDLIAQFVSEHRLLLVDEMRVLRKRITREAHKRTPG